MNRLLLSAFALLALAACSAPPIESERMRPAKSTLEALPVNTALFQKVAIGQASVPLNAAEEATAGNITQSGFRDALESALLDTAMLARVGTPGLYRLDARMTQFERPGWGFTFSVPCTVDYTLTRQTDGVVVWHQTIRAEGEAGFGDAFFNGIERRRIAMSNSVRENVKQFAQILSATPLGSPIVPRKPSPPATLPPELPPAP